MSSETEKAPRAFTEILDEVEHGYFAEELSRKFRDVVNAVRNQGKVGALTVTLQVKPVSGNTDMVTIAPGVKHKLPEPDRAPSTFFVALDGSPSRDHPSQLTDPALQPQPRATDTPEESS